MSRRRWLVSTFQCLWARWRKSLSVHPNGLGRCRKLFAVTLVELRAAHGVEVVNPEAMWAAR